MGQNVTVFGDIADSYDELVAYNEKGLDRWVDDLIEQRDGDPSSWNSFKMYAGMVAASGLISVQKFAGGFVDAGRLGNGVLLEGGLKGVGKDALRLLNVAGGAGAVLGRLTRVLKAVQAAGTANCVYVSAVNALRETGQKLLMPVNKLMQSAGVTLPGLGQTGGATASQYEALIALLRSWGVNVRRLMPTTNSLDEVVRFVQANRNGVLNFSVRWSGGGAHEFVASFSRAAGLLLKDPTGKIYRSVAELLRAHPGTTLFQGPMMFFKNAVIVTAAEYAGLASGLSQIAIQLMPIIPVVARDEETAGQVLQVRQNLIKTPPPQTPKTVPDTKPVGSLGYYEVKKGDWLSKIAMRPEYYGNMHKWPLIYEANLKTIGRDPNLIKPGQILLIPQMPAGKGKKK
jgi:LysM repeat protein